MQHSWFCHYLLLHFLFWDEIILVRLNYLTQPFIGSTIVFLSYFSLIGQTRWIFNGKTWRQYLARLRYFSTSSEFPNHSGVISIDILRRSRLNAFEKQGDTQVAAEYRQLASEAKARVERYTVLAVPLIESKT